MPLLFSRFPSFGAASLLGRAIQNIGIDVKSWYIIKDELTNFYLYCSDSDVIGKPTISQLDSFMKEDIIIIVGFCSIEHFISEVSAIYKFKKQQIIDILRQKTLVLFLSDSAVIRQFDKCVRDINNLQPKLIFAMPDLLPICRKYFTSPSLPLYQPIIETLAETADVATDKILCHAPCRKGINNVKGTNDIRTVF